MSTETPGKRRGPEGKKLAQPQIDEFLVKMNEGYNRTMTCVLLGISYRAFLRQLREDEGFAETVLIIEGSRVGICEQKLLDLVCDAIEPSIQLRAAIAYLGRRDKIDEARRVRREKVNRSRTADLGETGGSG